MIECVLNEWIPLLWDRTLKEKESQNSYSKTKTLKISRAKKQITQKEVLNTESILQSSLTDEYIQYQLTISSMPVGTLSAFFITLTFTSS